MIIIYYIINVLMNIIMLMLYYLYELYIYVYSSPLPSSFASPLELLRSLSNLKNDLHRSAEKRPFLYRWLSPVTQVEE